MNYYCFDYLYSKRRTVYYIHAQKEYSDRTSHKFEEFVEKENAIEFVNDLEKDGWTVKLIAGRVISFRGRKNAEIPS
jgi:hypothetical protein